MTSSRMASAPAIRGTYQKTVQIAADEFGLPNTNPPTVVDQDNITLYAFTVDTDRSTFKFAIPDDYDSGGLDLKVIWTNDGGADDNGKYAKWQLDYQVSDEGEALDGSHANSPKSDESAYGSDSGWIETRSGTMTIAEADISGKTCVLLKLSAVTTTGTALTGDPHLMGMCVTYTAKWGKR